MILLPVGNMSHPLQPCPPYAILSVRIPSTVVSIPHISPKLHLPYTQRQRGFWMSAVANIAFQDPKIIVQRVAHTFTNWTTNFSSSTRWIMNGCYNKSKKGANMMQTFKGQRFLLTQSLSKGISLGSTTTQHFLKKHLPNLMIVVHANGWTSVLATMCITCCNKK